MFFSGSAVTHLIHELFQLDGHWKNAVGRITKKRQRLGLLLADEDNPYIETVEFNHSNETIKGSGRRSFAFTGKISDFGKQLFPRKQGSR